MTDWPGVRMVRQGPARRSLPRPVRPPPFSKRGAYHVGAAPRREDRSHARPRAFGGPRRHRAVRFAREPHSGHDGRIHATTILRAPPRPGHPAPRSAFAAARCANERSARRSRRAAEPVTLTRSHRRHGHNADGSGPRGAAITGSDPPPVRSALAHRRAEPFPCAHATPVRGRRSAAAPRRIHAP